VRVLIAAVGRLRAGAERDLADDYVARVEKFGRPAGIASIKIAEIAESTAASADLRKSEEAERLLAALPAGAATVLLDERGEDFSSAELAQLIRRIAEAGTPVLAFLIGGPDGHGEAARRKADQSIRFGRATWPHRLVRAMLAEQVYRSVTILLNHPYHRA
jgi:23S rRNA (pseudouridine1915-N3)-methyltransferase